MTGIDIVHIPYKSTAPATMGLIGGEVDLMFSTTPPALPQVRAGKLRAIAMASLKRTSFAPEVPTVAESGIPGFEAGVWYGICAPAGTPPDIIDRLHRNLRASCACPRYASGSRSKASSRSAIRRRNSRAYLKTEMAKYAAIAQKAEYEPTSAPTDSG